MYVSINFAHLDVAMFAHTSFICSMTKFVADLDLQSSGQVIFSFNDTLVSFAVCFRSMSC